jgi:RNA polymerase sigma-70 factor, ECF subfamily
MDDAFDLRDAGLFDTRYRAFLETVVELRPSLHRYCARMTGSVSDGEDVVQEALFHAYRKLDTFDAERPLKPWLFQIAHNRCIDLLRRRGVREAAESEAEAPGATTPVEPVGPALDRAVERLVLTLPPKERACVLLKDVLGYSLEEIADLVDSSVGAVKAALNRGRAKLAAMPARPTPAPARPVSEEHQRLLRMYVERFNRRDWDGLRDLIAADAGLLVADRFAGPLSDSPYFGRYQRLTVTWRLVLADVDGELLIIKLHQAASEWVPHSVARLDIVDDRVVRIVDYEHCPWVLPAANAVSVLGTT